MVEVRREGDQVYIVSGDVTICVDVDDIPMLVQELVRNSGEHDQVLAELVTAGVDPYVARQLSTSVTLHQVRGWLRYIQRSEGLRRPVGFLVARLQQNEWPPEDDRRRYIDGEYGEYIKG